MKLSYLKDSGIQKRDGGTDPYRGRTKRICIDGAMKGLWQLRKLD